MMQYKVFTLLIITAFIRFSDTQGERCYTPFNRVGQCIPFQQCYSLLRLFESDKSRNSINFLTQSQRNCGMRNYRGDPLLCCTDSPTGRFVNPTTEPPTVIVLVEDEDGNFRPERPTTSRPERPQPQPDTSTPFVLRPKSTTSTPFVLRPRTSTLPGFTIQTNAPTPDYDCKGPDGVPGNCTPLKNCAYLLDQYAARRGDQQLIQFIRASNKNCNYAETAVCCPNESGSNSAPPTQAPNIPARLLAPHEGCGFSNASHNRVVGGVEAQKNAWPWMTLLGYTNSLGEVGWKCGGTLISKRHVLTAAHCIRKDLTTARLGEHDLRIETESQTIDVPVLRTQVHPEYDKRDGHSDIAILLLRNDVPFTNHIYPICIATEGALLRKNYVDYTPFVAGWGRTEEGGRPSDTLQEVQLPVLENDVCVSKYRDARRLISDKQFDDAVVCVGVLAGGKDSCQGDSGGPLMAPNNVDGVSYWYQLGVVSYGIGCARANVPGVYTSVQKFTPWIQQTVREMQQ